MNALLLTSSEYGHTSTFAFMFYQTTQVTVCLITHITQVAALTKMYAFTNHQNIRTLTTMYTLVSYQMALLTECLITYFISIWMFTSMYALMC